MSEDTQEGNPFKITSFAIDRQRTRAPGYFVMLPEEFFSAVGFVAVSWGAFETLFDNFLRAVFKANGKDFADAAGMPFRRRLTACRTESGHALSGLDGVLAILHGVLDDAETLYQARNLLVHGRTAMEMKSYVENGETRGEASLVCVGRYRGKERTEKYTRERLYDIFYSISHLSGRLHQISLAAPDYVPSLEISRLRVFLVS